MPDPVDVGFILPEEALPVDIGVVVEAFDVEALVVACDDLAQSTVSTPLSFVASF